MAKVIHIADPTLSPIQNAAKEKYLRAAQEYFMQRHEGTDKPQEILSAQMEQFLDHLRSQDFRNIPTEKKALEDYIARERDTVFNGTFKVLGLHKSYQAPRTEVPPPPASEWVERTEKVGLGTHAKRALSIVSVGIGSIIIADGLYGAVAPTRRTTINEDGTVEKKRVTPLNTEIAKIATGTGVMGLGYILSLERRAMHL